MRKSYEFDVVIAERESTACNLAPTTKRQPVPARPSWRPREKELIAGGTARGKRFGTPGATTTLGSSNSVYSYERLA